MQRHRMIGRLLEVGQDLGIHAGIQGSRGDDLLEQGRIHPAGAGTGDQQAARAQQLEGQQVDILVAAGGLLGLGGGRGELGRVEHDQVEGTRLVTEFAQELEDIPFQDGVTGDIQ